MELGQLELSSLFLVLLSLPLLNATHVSIRSNGYEDIVVALTPELNESENEFLISNIKNLFINASISLYNATRQRAYFRQVTILVPKTWTRKPEYARASFETFADADVRVDKANPMYGDAPYTLQPQPCGSPGLYIHLTPNYLRNVHDNSSRVFGDPGKTLVHEWAHLRYGIFDEFGYLNDNQFPLFYYDYILQDVFPNHCSNKLLKGKYWDLARDAPCLFKDDWPGKNCVFQPDMDDNLATSSIASYHFLPNITTFCDDTDEHRHNRQAPNKHNTQCNSRSTWDVVSNHKDFRNNRNPPTVITDLTPGFKIVQQMEETISLVLDASTSMKAPSTFPKEIMLREVVSRWLKEEVVLGTALGIVTFNEKAEERHPMKKVESDLDRQRLVGSLPNDTHGYTCIGCGLQMALQQLYKYRGTFGGTIILLTDGEENRTPYVYNMKQQLREAKVRIITIAFTEEAATHLEMITELTSGKSYFVSLKAGIQALGAAFYDSITYQTTNVDAPVKIHDMRYSAEDVLIYKGNFTVDSTLGSQTIINFVYFNKADIRNISITGDDVDISMFTKNGGFKKGRVTFDDISKLIRFQFEFLKNGTYSYTIERKGLQQDITVTITSKSSSKLYKPIITRCWVEQETNSGRRPIFLILAEVKQGVNPVINAKVFASIERPGGRETILLQLYDNGASPDVTANDGIYTRYFNRYSGKGRYSVKAQVTDDGKAVIQETGFIASRSLPIVNKYMIPPVLQTRMTGSFERVADGGSFQLKEELDVEKSDEFPPGRVTDLHIKRIHQNVAILHWTAPGDDSDFGTASSYIFRYSNDWDEIYSYFNGTQIQMNVIPNEAGTLETIRFAIPEGCHKEPYYLAMRAVDKVNQSSLTSNIVRFNGVNGCTPIRDDDMMHSVLVILCILGIFVFFVVLVVLVSCIYRTRRTRDHYKVPQDV